MFKYMEEPTTHRGYFLENPSIYEHSEFTDKPEISFFKEKHYRHVNFSMQNMDVLLNNNLNFGEKAELIVPKNGDLLHKIYFSFDLPVLPNGTYYVNSIGHSIIDKIDIYIDSQLIDSHTGYNMHIFNEMFTTINKKNAVDNFIQNFYTNIELKASAQKERNIIVPFTFWFCNHIEQSIPLVAMRNSELRIIITLNSLDKLITGTPLPSNDISKYCIKHPKLMLDYIFLNDTERMNYISKDIEYTIEQIKTQTLNRSIKYDINIDDDNEFEYQLECTGPVKFMTWTILKNTNVIDYNFITDNIINADILINGTSLVKSSKKPNSGLFKIMSYHNSNKTFPRTNIHSFPMCLHMDSSIPNGSTNVSNVNDFKCIFKLNKQVNTPTSTLDINFHKYNVLKFSEGVGMVLFD